MNINASALPVSGDYEADLGLFCDAMAVRNLQPFGGGDSTAGMEFELQVAVQGEHRDVDLPITIRASSFFNNVIKRTSQGDLPPTCLNSLRQFLHGNQNKVWENSWVRFPEYRLTTWSRTLFSRDLLADKGHPASRLRGDAQRFRCIHRGQQHLRLPISYLLKLSLANLISGDDGLSPVLIRTGRALLDHFISDNTSPEVLSFSIRSAATGQIGELAAAEATRTLLFVQLLAQYANHNFGLIESGQKCMVYSAPHAPLRQKQLNDFVPDGFYRHLFMSPCLSGWDRGEEKYRYMELCHKTLSRSQLNTIAKLKDAGIITNNLVVLPNTSNTCLANNGTHVSLGSQILSTLAGNRESLYTGAVEKYCGDLVIKIVEHFLPLFVDTYSAAPYRLDFGDFHPEKVLGFLPHELDYTHLRMLWRRWRKKADIGFLGHPLTPFGPPWLDRPLATLLRLRGDLVPDFRLIDYLMTLLSTESSPALNGMPGNQERLKEELAEMGVFDPRMAIYLPYRQRLFASAGYAGFEGRSYSLFPSLKSDMAEAVALQNLVTALAFGYLLEGKVSHHDIPDRPSIESERRQIFFACAIGIPTFFVRADTGNRFLRRILTGVGAQRNSRRYKGYIRVGLNDYRLALVDLIESDGAALIEQLGLRETIRSLRLRLADPAASASARIVAAVSGSGGSRTARRTAAATFNSATEHYYQNGLKRSHLEEALTVFEGDCRYLEEINDPHFRQTMATVTGGSTLHLFFARHRQAIVDESADQKTLNDFLRLSLAIIHYQRSST